LGIFFDEKFFFEDEARAVLSDPKNREALPCALHVFESFPEITTDGWPSLLSQLEEETGRKGKNLFSPLRAGITGKMKGPELAKTKDCSSIANGARALLKREFRISKHEFRNNFK